jgi:hypothetical protein
VWRQPVTHTITYTFASYATITTITNSTTITD